MDFWMVSISANREQGDNRRHRDAEEQQHDSHTDGEDKGEAHCFFFLGAHSEHVDRGKKVSAAYSRSLHLSTPIALQRT